MATIDIKKFTLAVSIIAIFVSISIIIWAIRKYGKASPKTLQYPPYISPCPDFWESVGVNPDNTHTCRPSNKDTTTAADGPTAENSSMNGLQTCNIDNINSNSAYSEFVLPQDLQYSPSTTSVNFTAQSDAVKCKWADKCGVYWEGISGRACTEMLGGTDAS